MEEMQSKMATVGKTMRKSIAIFRKTIEDRIYSIYSKSINTANVKNSNSFLLFITNFKHFLKLNASLLEGSVNLYAELFDHVDKFTSGRLARETDPFEVDCSSLNEYNDWIANLIQEVFKSKQVETQIQKNDENARFLTLFRLLTIRYRAENPITGTQKKKIVLKIKRILSHTIVGSLEEFFMSLK